MSVSAQARQRIVLIGASSLIAEHCARLWATVASDLVLVGRSSARLDRVADDLRVRSPSSTVSVRLADFDSPTEIAEMAKSIANEAPIDVVLIAHGNLPDQQACQQSLALIREAIAANALSPILFAEAFAGLLLEQGRGTLAIIGSVAGDRGRRSNYVYGSAKGLIERYAQGLSHRFSGHGPRVVLIKPGPTASPMTRHLPPKGLADPESVARAIVAGIGRGRAVVYAPARWWLIMMIIRHLPRFVFHKLDI